jgi:hypothetical protein
MSLLTEIIIGLGGVGTLVFLVSFLVAWRAAGSTIRPLAPLLDKQAELREAQEEWEQRHAFWTSELARAEAAEDLLGVAQARENLAFLDETRPPEIQSQQQRWEEDQKRIRTWRRHPIGGFWVRNTSLLATPAEIMGGTIGTCAHCGKQHFLIGDLCHACTDELAEG